MILNLNCNDPREKSDTALCIGNGDTKGTARHNARVLIDLAIRRAAWNFAKDFKCVQEGCRIKKVMITFGQPHLTAPAQPPIGGGGGAPLKWNCKATCDWSVKVFCPRKAKLPKKDEIMEKQQLDCHKKEQAFACKTAHGAASNANKSRAEEEAIKGVMTQAQTDIDQASNKVSCSADCPKKQITLELGPITDVTDPSVPQPDANGDFAFNKDMRWAIWISCG